MASSNNYYSVSSFDIDINERTVYHKGQILDCPEKSFDLIARLLQANKHTLDKNTLLDELWEDSVVSESSLSRLVSDTRQFISQYEPEQEIIQTLRGKGFRIHPKVSIIERETAEFTFSQPVISESNQPLVKSRFIKSNGKYISTFIIITIIAIIVLFRMQINTPDQITSNVPNQGLLNAGGQASGRLTVLPVQIFTNDDQDDWVEYGVMSMAITHFKAYENIDVSSIETTLKTLSSIQYDVQSENVFEQVCASLGCTQLLVFDLELNEKNQPVLSYVLVGANQQITPKSSFIGSDILDSANFLLEHALQRLITHTPQRKDLHHTYTNNSAANMDYAIGVDRLYHGDLDSAQEYLGLALKREPNFTWAQIYQADLLYRQAEYDEAEKAIKHILAQSIDVAQKVTIALIQSNIAYDKGALSESIEIARNSLSDIEALNDQELLGSTHMNIGTSLQAIGQLDGAIEHLEKALAVYQKFGFKLREAQAIFNLANTIWLKTQDTDLVLDKYAQAARIFRQLGSNSYLAYSKHMSGAVKVSSKRYDLAKRDLNEAISLFEALDDPQSVLWVDLDLANIALAQLNYAEAESIALSAYNRAGEITYIKAHTSALLAIAYLKTKQLDKAKRFIDERTNYEWFDPRPMFSMLDASYAHASGDLQKAVDLSALVKTRLGVEWQAGHDAFSEAFAADLRANKRSLIDYGAAFPEK